MPEPFDYYAHYFTVRNEKLAHPIPEEAADALLPAIIDLEPAGKPLYDDDAQLQRTTNFSVTRTPKGRIFLTYFAGGGHADEDTGNWNMIISSDDDGKSFHQTVAVNPPNPNTTRVFEGNLWLDPKGALWYFYVQCYRRMDGRLGVWCIKCDDPDADKLVFSAPRRLCDGIIPAPPIVLKDGRWVFTSYLHTPAWMNGAAYHDLETCEIFWNPEKIGIAVNVSSDEGKTFTQIAKGIQFPYATFYENCLVEKQDGTLWILIRGMNCVGQTFSKDGGYTWSPVVPKGDLPLPNTHFFINRLKNGNLLLICNYKADMFSYYIGRNHLTALLSKDDGQTWEGKLLLDEREGVEQPGFYEADNGFIYISYGRAPQLAGETLLAVVTEEDILAGKLVNPKSRLRVSAGRCTGMLHASYFPELLKVAKKYNIEM